MTIAELEDRVPNAEYVAWNAFHIRRAQMEQLASGRGVGRRRG